MHPEYVFLLRLVLAAVFGALLGWERERAGKAAGLRTHIAVAIAASLYTALAELSVRNYEGDVGLRADPIRAIQAVAIGIGFLGAGMIVVNRAGTRVLGLTTAASIWATAAIGVATALAHYRLALGATLLLVAVLRGLARFDRDGEEPPMAPERSGVDPTRRPTGT